MRIEPARRIGVQFGGAGILPAKLSARQECLPLPNQTELIRVVRTSVLAA